MTNLEVNSVAGCNPFIDDAELYLDCKGKMFGRREIFTNEREITAENVVSVLQKALQVHLVNRREIQYLHRYLRGRQPILNREKVYNKEICNKVVVNRANEIVTFKTANFIGEPLQYVSRGADQKVPEQIEQLNSFMFSENKAERDMELAYWMFTCGVGYRLTLRDKAVAFMNAITEEEPFDEAPFEIYTLDPRNTFVVKKNDVTRRVMMGVSYVFDDNKNPVYTVYTQNQTFYIRGSVSTEYEILEVSTHNFGMVPIVEYPCNTLRMGAFEMVLDLLDAINLTESNRLDGIEQFIQAVMVFEGVDATREQIMEMKDLGAIKIPNGADGRSGKVYYLNEQLDQTQTQTLIDDMYQTVLSIVGMPSQGNANTSDSSNNGAVIMKNGWWNAEARAKETVSLWKGSETDFLKIVLKICRETSALDLKLSQIEQKFGRSSYEDKLTKVQSFVSLITAGCPPIQAFTYSGLTVDPESAAIAYERYQEEKEAEQEKKLQEEMRRSNQTTETIVTEDGVEETVTEDE